MLQLSYQQPSCLQTSQISPKCIARHHRAVLFHLKIIKNVADEHKDMTVFL